MEALFLLIHRYARTPGIGDTLLRGAILAFYLSAAVCVHRTWLAFAHSGPSQAKGLVYPAVVYGMVFYAVFVMIGAPILELMGMKNASRGLLRFMTVGVVYLLRVTITTTINFMVLVLRLGVAAIVPGNVLQTCTDALATFMEREADALTG